MPKFPQSCRADRVQMDPAVSPFTGARDRGRSSVRREAGSPGIRVRAIADDAPFARRGLGRRVVAFELALEELREAVVGQVHELAEPQRLADGAHVDVEPVDDDLRLWRLGYFGGYIPVW